MGLEEGEPLPVYTEEERLRTGTEAADRVDPNNHSAQSTNSPSHIEDDSVTFSPLPRPMLTRHRETVNEVESDDEKDEKEEEEGHTRSRSASFGSPSITYFV